MYLIVLTSCAMIRLMRVNVVSIYWRSTVSIPASVCRFMQGGFR